MENDKRVVPLHKGALIPGLRYEPNQEVVAELEYLLGAAKAGELAGLAYASAWTDTSVGSRYVGAYSRGLVGGLFAVATRISTRIDDDIKNKG
jgi:hypothetical protein